MRVLLDIKVPDEFYWLRRMSLHTLDTSWNWDLENAEPMKKGDRLMLIVKRKYTKRKTSKKRKR